MSSVAFLGPQSAPKSLATGSSPQTQLGKLELTALSDPVSGFKGHISKATTSKRRNRNGKGRQGMVRRKMIYSLATGHGPRAPETLAPPLLLVALEISDFACCNNNLHVKKKSTLMH